MIEQARLSIREYETITLSADQNQDSLDTMISQSIFLLFPPSDLARILKTEGPSEAPLMEGLEEEVQEEKIMTEEAAYGEVVKIEPAYQAHY